MLAGFAGDPGVPFQTRKERAVFSKNIWPPPPSPIAEARSSLRSPCARVGEEGVTGSAAQSTVKRVRNQNAVVFIGRD